MKQRMRPTFEVPLACAPEAFRSAVEESIALDRRCAGKTFRRHAVLCLAERERHFWSPYLQLEVRLKSEEPWASEASMDSDTVFGRFSPHPSVWTGFMAVYATIGMAATAASVWGFAELMLGRFPYGWLGVPAALALGAFVYGGAFIGQGLGAEQMYELRRVVDRALDSCSSASSDTQAAGRGGA